MSASENDSLRLNDTTYPLQTVTTSKSEAETPIITLKGRSGQISVRSLRFSDAQRTHQLADNDKIWINMRDRFPHPYTLDASYTWIAYCRSKESWHTTNAKDPQDKAADVLLPTSWAITIDDEAVGGLGLRFSADVERRTAELGYWLGEPYWGHGITTKVVCAFLEWSWIHYPDIVRIEASAYAWNKRSQRVLEKLGFNHESTRRAAIFKDGKITDLIEFALLRPGIERTLSHELSA